MTTGIVAAVDRNGVDESFHHGTVVVADPSGCRALVGDIDTVIYPRSSLKPLQTTAMLTAGLRLDSRGLALACASHDGSPAHLAVVREVLAGAGRSEADLATTPDLPYDRGEAERVLSGGGGRTSLQMNCSGKHAAMIATCVAAGLPVAGHLEPDHPLQVHIAVIADQTSPRSEAIADIARARPPIGTAWVGAPQPSTPMCATSPVSRSTIAAMWTWSGWSGSKWPSTGHPAATQVAIIAACLPEQFICSDVRPPPPPSTRSASPRS